LQNAQLGRAVERKCKPQSPLNREPPIIGWSKRNDGNLFDPIVWWGLLRFWKFQTTVLTPPAKAFAKYCGMSDE